MAFGMTMVLAACGGGGGGTPPVTVAAVVITAPAAPPTFATLGRTVQFAAQAKDAAGAVISGPRHHMVFQQYRRRDCQ